MIQIKKLTYSDSESCIQLHVKRQQSDSAKVFVNRTNNFFDIYKFYSNNHISYGAFSDNRLVGMCSFIKVNGPVAKYFVTDFIVLKEFSGHYVGPQILDAFWEDRLSKYPLFELNAVEEHLNSLEIFKSYLRRYNIESQEDKYIYSHLKKAPSMINENVKLEFSNTFDDTLKIDSEAVVLSVNNEEITLFTDRAFRNFSIDNQKVSRLYMKGELEKNQSEMIPYMLQRASERKIDYILLLSEKKINSSFDYVYFNRVLSFTKNTKIHSGLSINNGILI